MGRASNGTAVAEKETVPAVAGEHTDKSSTPPALTGGSAENVAIDVATPKAWLAPTAALAARAVLDTRAAVNAARAKEDQAREDRAIDKGTALCVKSGFVPARAVALADAARAEFKAALGF